MKDCIAFLKSQHESLVDDFEHLSKTAKLTKYLEMKYEDCIKVSYLTTHILSFKNTKEDIVQ